MSKEKEPFKPDFILINPTEMRVRQGVQDTRLDTPLVLGEFEDVWECTGGTLDNEQTIDGPSDQECASVWESTLERL